MKKVLQTVAAAAVSTGLMAGVTTTALAATNACSIVNGNGSGSTNTCTVTNTNDLDISCTNNADVVFINGQSANSGNVTLNGNGQGGYAYSGSAVNTNQTTGKLDVSCGPQVAAAPVTPTTNTPAAVSAAPAPAKGAAPKVAALPETGSDTALVAAGAGVAGLVGLMAVSRLGVTAYRRHTLK